LSRELELSNFYSPIKRFSMLPSSPSIVPIYPPDAEFDERKLVLREFISMLVF